MLSSENQNTKYKRTWSDEYLKWICGFANAQGGKIYTSVADDRNRDYPAPYAQRGNTKCPSRCPSKCLSRCPPRPFCFEADDIGYDTERWQGVKGGYSKESPSEC